MNSSSGKKPIQSLSLGEIYRLCDDCSQPKYRADQLIRWLFGKSAESFSDMTNLPKAFRELLDKHYYVGNIQLVDRQVSQDGTRKYVFEYHDGIRVEAVGIPSLSHNKQGEPKDLTVCFSTQAGCPMQCSFCATGKEGFERNLISSEMLDQILSVQKDFGIRVSRLVSMGQGEPLLNYDELIGALAFSNSSTGFNIGARHITISTCGIIQGILHLGDDPHQYTLAISLHAARQEIRDALMPRCKSVPLPDLKNALLDYQAKTRRRVSFEYLMIRGVNDSEEDFLALENFTSGIMSHINLIPINPVKDSGFQPSDNKTIYSWTRQLNNDGISTTVRNSRGSDIQGACGQLKNSLG